MNLSPKQIDAYMESNARINILEGSVRSGKSFISLLRFVKELRHGPDGAYVVTGKSESSLIRNVIDPLVAMTGGGIKYNRGTREFSLFGRKVHVVGANDERSETKIRGATFAGALVDEVTIIPQSFFRMLLSRLSIEGAKLFGTTNPDSPYHWLKTDFIDRKEELDLKVFPFRLEDNPSLGKNYIDSLKKEYQGVWYRRMIMGEWVVAEGSIFDFFDVDIHVKNEPPTYAQYYILGIDYGTTNPFAAVLLGVNHDHKPTLWIEKEYYWDSKVMGYQKTDSDYAMDIGREFGGYPIRTIYLDPAAASFEIELKRNKMPVRQAKNDVIDGIRYVAALFTQGDLVICKKCKNLIKEIEGYVWDEKSAREGIDKPMKQRDHAIDAMRYACFSHFGSRHTLKETTEQERYSQAQQRAYQKNPMAYPGFTNSHGWQPIR